MTVIVGDCREVMAAMEPESVDAVVCDPPYDLTNRVVDFLKCRLCGGRGHGGDDACRKCGGPLFRQRSGGGGFMGKDWDGTGVAFDPATWAEVLRVLRPGGHLIAFSGTRTSHRMVCAIEDAGFEIRDSLCWMFGSGMPKSWNFDNQLPADDWCACGGNAVSYSHEHTDEEAQHDLRLVRDSDLSETFDAPDQRREVLQPGVPKPHLSGDGTEDGTGIDAGREQSRMAGRSVRRAGEGLRDGSDAGPSEGAAERVRVGAHPGGGAHVGPIPLAWGGSPSPQPEQGGQRAGEPAGLRNAPRTLDGGALRDGGRCPRCGKLSQAFRGFGSALKPAHEPICLARKPLAESGIAANVAAWGTGALNIDATRLGALTAAEVARSGKSTNGSVYGDFESVDWKTTGKEHPGRWPANVALDEDAAALLDAQSGQRPSGAMKGEYDSWGTKGIYGKGRKIPMELHASTGGASRFMYVAKASRAERGEGNGHPCVKPLALMQWLCRMVTPPGGLVLDPFCGSGSTGVAAQREGFRFVGIEMSEDYAAIARARIDGDAPLLRQAGD